MATYEAESLPALISKAGQRLAEAKSSAEVLEARAAAQAAMHYAKVTKAANDTQADCLRMIVRAEMRMADEIDKVETAQGRRSDLDRSADEVATREEMGLSRQRVAEFRDLRDAGEEVIETRIRRAVDEGRSPRKSELLKAAREIKGKYKDDPVPPEIKQYTALINEWSKAEEAARARFLEAIGARLLAEERKING